MVIKRITIFDNYNTFKGKCCICQEVLRLENAVKQVEISGMLQKSQLKSFGLKKKLIKSTPANNRLCAK